MSITRSDDPKDWPGSDSVFRREREAARRRWPDGAKHYRAEVLAGCIVHLVDGQVFRAHPTYRAHPLDPQWESEDVGNHPGYPMEWMSVVPIKY